jgi:hypothetical protein
MLTMQDLTPHENAEPFAKKINSASPHNPHTHMI